MLRIRPLILAALTGAFAAAPTAAHAADPPVAATYDAQFEGVYTLRATESGEGVMDATRSADVAWRSTARGLRITRLPDDATAVRETDAPMATVGGAYHEVVHSVPPLVQHCDLSLASPPPKGIVGARSQADRQVIVDFEPFQRVDMTKTCTYPTPVPDESILGAHFTGKAAFSRDRVGDAQIILPVESAESQPCPSYEFTTSCEASWRGRITLTRTGVEEAPSAPTQRPPATPQIDPSDIPPLVPPAPQIDPSDIPPLVPPAPQIDPSDIPPLVEPSMEDLLAPLVPSGQSARIDRRGTLRFTAHCPRGCSGTVSIRPSSSATSGRAARAVRTRRVAVRVPAGGPRTVAVRLPAATRRTLRARRKATVTLVLTDAGTRRTTRARLLARVA